MIPFGTLVRAELRKTVDVRAARWSLFAAALLAAGAEAVPLVFPHNVTQDRASCPDRRLGGAVDRAAAGRRHGQDRPPRGQLNRSRR
jgi:hypothetical protein